MKKRILAVLLSTLILANITACNTAPKNELESTVEKTEEDQPNTIAGLENTLQTSPNENETLRDVPELGLLRLCSYFDNSPKASVWWSDEKKEHYVYINETDTYRLQDELSPYDFYWYLIDESNNETVRDVQGLGQLKLFRSCNASTKASIWWSDEKEEFYIYINDWDAYRLMRGLSIRDESDLLVWWYLYDNCIAIDNEATTVSLIYQEGKHHEPIIITYRLHRSNELVEVHAVPLNIIASCEYDTYFVNMHDTNHGYYFLTTRMDGRQDLDGVRGWPLFMFETTDGGKSWNPISTNTFSPGASDYINILKFVSPQVGIISFRDLGECEAWKRTYLTVDGGLTWNQMPPLPYPSGLNGSQVWYSEIIDIEYIDDCYVLTVDGHYLNSSDNNNPSVEFRFESKDLINWSLIQ